MSSRRNASLPWSIKVEWRLKVHESVLREKYNPHPSCKTKTLSVSEPWKTAKAEGQRPGWNVQMGGKKAHSNSKVVGGPFSPVLVTFQGHMLRLLLLYFFGEWAGVQVSQPRMTIRSTPNYSRNDGETHPTRVFALTALLVQPKRAEQTAERPGSR